MGTSQYTDGWHRDPELRGKVAVVTGSSAGMGRRIAKVLAREGAETVIVSRRMNFPPARRWWPPYQTV